MLHRMARNMNSYNDSWGWNDDKNFLMEIQSSYHSKIRYHKMVHLRVDVNILMINGLDKRFLNQYKFEYINS